MKTLPSLPWQLWTGFAPALALFCSQAMAFAAPLKADGYVLETDKPPRKISLLAADKTTVRYLEDGKERTITLGKDITIFECEPPEYSKAMELYQARRYPEAMVRFAAVKKEYAALGSMEDSHASLAAFHELECRRKTGDLAGLAAGLQQLPQSKLTREWQRRQLELYVFWDALRNKNWERLDRLAKEHATVRLVGGQRAQVAYCHGMALEGLGRLQEALIEYNTAITADAGASEEITRQAALRILAIYQMDPEVRAALKSPGGGGRAKLDEAMAVAALFESSLGAGAALPQEFKEFRRPAPKPPGGSP